ncbi:thiamine-phosphate kinase [Pararhodospirillum oryzae]|uniref:Thiamine-monophosphate kinase n=1 Tax=Pararhodospirillum oryzae TaxID=478448 RepID=A0A512HAJ6_9PROT|nr:thiamine-phosphate kinase [Pararhodospirillum oryzae]GEO82477.1 thiamine-monophosphate kinase [Pararhodospirillum oryzae]
MGRRGEFALIRDLFRPLAQATPQALDLADDAAVLSLEGQGDLVASADALVSGVHFLPADPPATIAAKCLRVNLSDLAAMGARPLGVLITAALSAAQDDAWMEAFARGLGEDLTAFGLALLGGDTVSTPGPATFSITILGTVPAGEALRRNHARPGHDLWVSGTLGDGALGLLAAQGQLLGLPAPLHDHLVDRYRRPCPRVALGMGLRGLAGGCMDVSDGLCADAAHMARASGVAIEIDAPDLPLSEAAALVIADAPERFHLVLGGGDDYELLFSAPAEARDAVRKAGADAGVAVTRIGRVLPVAASAMPGVRVCDATGGTVGIDHPGWTHDA